MGYIAPDLIHPFFGEIAKHLSNVLRSKGYDLLMASSEEDEDLEIEEIERMLARDVDVLMLASCQRGVERLHVLEQGKTPLLLLDRRFEGYQAHFVGVNDALIGGIATKHLIDQGCRLIAYIGSAYVSTALGRREGYRAELIRAGLPFQPEYCILREHGDDAADQTGRQAMIQLLSLKPQPDAVFCVNDPTAVGAMKAILEAGLRIPHDIAVVGCGNTRTADFLRVPLTTIDQDSTGIGRESAKLALNLAGGRRKLKTVLLEPRLVVRDSSLRRQ